MTNSNWKPVPHRPGCRVLRPLTDHQCTCSGTRWHGYGERVGDFAGVWALTGWLAGLSEPEPFAWFVVDASRTRYATVNSEGAALAYIEAKRIGTVLRPMPVYAAPVPAQDDRADVVANICNAYESGVGHRGRPTAHVNPYPRGSDESMAYALGAIKEHHGMLPAQDDARDAERYRWLRSQFWADGGLCVIKDAKKYTRLGAYMPFEKLLDDELDAAMLAAQQQKNGGE